VVKLNSGATVAAKTPVKLGDVTGINASDGSVAGFIGIEGATATLTYRDLNFATPKAVTLNGAPVTPSNRQMTFHQRGTDLMFLVLSTAAGGTQLFRHDMSSSGTLTGPLYTFTNTAVDASDLTHDANNLYFSDGNKILSMPLSATAAGQSTAVLTMSNAQTTIDNLHLTQSSGRIVFNATIPGSFPGLPGPGSGVYSVPTGGGTATTLKTDTVDPQHQKFIFAFLLAVGGNIAYINVNDGSTGASSAMRVNSDGTSPVTTANSSWVGFILPTTFNVGIGSFDSLPITSLLKSTSGTTAGDIQLRLFAAATGAAGRIIGTVHNVAAGSASAGFGAAIGRYGVFSANISRGASASDLDSFIFDANTAGSLRDGVTNPGTEDNPFAGL
jgi:hypothetical protein